METRKLNLEELATIQGGKPAGCNSASSVWGCAAGMTIGWFFPPVGVISGVVCTAASIYCYYE